MFFKKIITPSIFLFLFSLAFLEGKEYQVAFYSDFEPISYSDSRDPANPQFESPEGYEVDLLRAMEAIPGSDMTFKFDGVKEWNDIWLLPYTHPKIDIAIGGITREDSRLLNEEGKQVVANTHKTTQFKQSLLMTAKEAVHIKNHEDLTCAYVVGAVRGTTGNIVIWWKRTLLKIWMEDPLKKG